MAVTNNSLHFTAREHSGRFEILDGGTSRFVTPRERVDMEALELFAGVGLPVADRLEVTFTGLPGAHSVVSPRAVFAGQPCIIMAEADGPGIGTLELAWDADGERQRLSLPLDVTHEKTAETARLLQGARLITDTEANLLGELNPTGREQLDDRKNRRIREKLEQLSRDYGLASRAMALVAVVTRPGDDATKIPTTKVVPIGMPQDVQFESYLLGVRHRSIFTKFKYQQKTWFCGAPPMLAEYTSHYLAAPEREPLREPSLAGDDRLMELAARLLPDGGLPGDHDDTRLFTSFVLLVCLAQSGHTCNRGAFRLHVRRLVGYVKSRTDLAPQAWRDWIREVVEKIEKDEPEAFGPPAGDLPDFCTAAMAHWKLLAQRLGRVV